MCKNTHFHICSICVLSISELQSYTNYWRRFMKTIYISFHRHEWFLTLGGSNAWTHLSMKTVVSITTLGSYSISNVFISWNQWLDLFLLPPSLKYDSIHPPDRHPSTWLSSLYHITPIPLITIDGKFSQRYGQLRKHPIKAFQSLMWNHPSVSIS